MQRKQTAKRDRILEVASKLFAERDFHDVKLEEVAKKAEVAKGSIYTYFKSKDYLFFKCIGYGLENFSKQALDIINNFDFDSAFKKLIDLFMEVVKMKGPLVATACKQGPKLKISSEEHNEFLEMGEKGIEIMTLVFKNGIDCGELKDTFTPRQMAIIFQGVFNVSTAFIYHGEIPISSDQIYSIFMGAFKKQG